jgi:hypothetical protein
MTAILCFLSCDGLDRILSPRLFADVSCLLTRTDLGSYGGGNYGSTNYGGEYGGSEQYGGQQYSGQGATLHSPHLILFPRSSPRFPPLRMLDLVAS